MVFGHLALVVAALFTGAALYINAVEQPARLELPDGPALSQWEPAQRRGFALQAGLALLGAIFGALAFYQVGNWRWLAGGMLMLATWPYTYVALMPLSARLRACERTPKENPRRLLANWGQLHMVRTGLAALATLIFFWASLA